jgi:hypothetical protein
MITRAILAFLLAIWVFIVAHIDRENESNKQTDLNNSTDEIEE